ncbi:YdhR family protein [Streptosporangium sp. NPDC023963]|uniref:YdhR family protein n=1 Tax=Streptosporangium sp. NPDC023963 TaxID=3155608 RepID=UPI00341554D7
MHAQLITYRLTDVPRQEVIDNLIKPYTEYFAKLETLVSKVWLNDEATGNYGGFYVWRDKAAFDEFMQSDAAADIIGKPFVVELTSRDWPIDVEASQATRGIPS